MIAKNLSLSKRLSSKVMRGIAGRVNAVFECGIDGSSVKENKNRSVASSTTTAPQNQRQNNFNIDSFSMVSSPESALGFIHSGELLAETKADTKKESVLSVHEPNTEFSSMISSPETALGAIHVAEIMESQGSGSSSTEQISCESTIDSLSMFASPETAFGAIHFAEMLDGYAKTQLQELESRKESIPLTMEEVMMDPRPIVVTSAVSPFSIVEVNDAWIGLCGYEREEAVDRTLGDLLQGPETNPNVARDMVNRLKEELYAEAVLTNYSKTGRKFDNFVKVAKLSSGVDEENDVSDLFVGVLEEISLEDRNSRLKNAMM